MLFNVAEPNVDVSCDRCRKPCVDEEVASMMVQRFTLSLMFDGRTVLAVDVQDDPAVKDVVKSQQVEP